MSARVLLAAFVVVVLLGCGGRPEQASLPRAQANPWVASMLGGEPSLSLGLSLEALRRSKSQQVLEAHAKAAEPKLSPLSRALVHADQIEAHISVPEWSWQAVRESLAYVVIVRGLKLDPAQVDGSLDAPIRLPSGVLEYRGAPAPTAIGSEECLVYVLSDGTWVIVNSRLGARARAAFSQQSVAPAAMPLAADLVFVARSNRATTQALFEYLAPTRSRDLRAAGVAGGTLAFRAGETAGDLIVDFEDEHRALEAERDAQHRWRKQAKKSETCRADPQCVDVFAGISDKLAISRDGRRLRFEGEVVGALIGLVIFKLALENLGRDRPLASTWAQSVHLPASSR